MTTIEFRKLLDAAIILATKLANDGNRCQAVQDYLANNGIHAGYNSVALMLMINNIALADNELKRLTDDIIQEDFEFDNE